MRLFVKLVCPPRQTLSQRLSEGHLMQQCKIFVNFHFPDQRCLDYEMNDTSGSCGTVYTHIVHIVSLGVYLVGGREHKSDIWHIHVKVFSAGINQAHGYLEERDIFPTPAHQGRSTVYIRISPMSRKRREMDVDLIKLQSILVMHWRYFF